MSRRSARTAKQPTKPEEQTCDVETALMLQQSDIQDDLQNIRQTEEFVQAINGLGIVEVRDSLHVQGGKGLWAINAITKFTTVAVLTFATVKQCKEKVTDLPKSEGYNIQVAEKMFIFVDKHTKEGRLGVCLGGMANDCGVANEKDANCAQLLIQGRDQQKGKPVQLIVSCLVTVHDIPPDTELLLSYSQGNAKVARTWPHNDV